jgi:hypothetical protein
MILKLWIAAVGFLGILPLAVTAQEPGPLLVTPDKASVTAGESQRLTPGQPYIFQLRFNPPPEGLGGGKINYRFQRVDPPASSGSSYSIYGQTTTGGETELHDGQAIYTLSLPTTDLMLPGKWKLVEVTLGRNIQKPVLIPENIIFEIPEISSVVLHVQVPKNVKAGQRFTIKIKVDEYPKGLAQGCVPMLAGYLHQARPNGQPNPGAFNIPINRVELKPDRHSYEMSGSLDPDIPSGPWQGEVSVSAIPLDFRMHRFCRSPQNKGDVRFTFTVEPAMGLVMPTSVAVTVNPSQIQLLLAEADRLKAKAEHLRQQLNSKNMAANQVLLRNSVQEATTDLDKTENIYKQKGLDHLSAQAVNIFFDDIRLNYGEALKVLANDSARGAQTGPRLERVSAVVGGSSPRLNRASQAVLASILHNARAYNVVASSGLITFNLEVSSDPQGASVFYGQRGEKYHSLYHETDWRIDNLPRAVYLIRFQKQGYVDREVTFDAINNTSSNIHVRLVRKRGAR